MKKTQVSVGSTPTDILRLIADLNPDIRTFLFRFYAPYRGVSEEKTGRSSVASKMRHDTYEMTRLDSSVVKKSKEPDFGLMKGRDPEELISVCSVVSMRSGGVAHIPMMDFECSISDENTEKIKDFVRISGQKGGVILKTERSYHYYGFYLLSEKDWIRFLGDSLLAEICDVRYIGHRLKDGYAGLRITSGGIRNTPPTVIFSF